MHVYIASSELNILKCLSMITDEDTESVLLLESFSSGAVLAREKLAYISKRIRELHLSKLADVEVVASTHKSFIQSFFSHIKITGFNYALVDHIISGNVWSTGISPLTRDTLRMTRTNSFAKLTVLEDGSMMYLGDFSSWDRPGLLSKIKEGVLCDLNIVNNSRISAWLVENPTNYEFIKVPTRRFKYFDNQVKLKTLATVFLSDSDIGQIEKIKSSEDLDCVIFTQPLFKSGLVESLDIQVKLISKLINRYASDAKKIYIKVHPADFAKYQNIASNVEILGNFPSELMNAFGVKFKTSIGLFSSAIETVQADEYIYDVNDYNNVTKIPIFIGNQTLLKKSSQ